MIKCKDCEKQESCVADEEPKIGKYIKKATGEELNMYEFECGLVTSKKVKYEP